MSLYVKVSNNFYTHRKTLRLRALIGDDAFWVPPRLWAYAADNQPDGCFTDYSSDELAMLIGYSKDASSMLQALLKAGFLDSDPLRIHDWSEHNGYHAAFSDRAAKAAAARWKKKNEIKEIGEDKRREETSIASSMLEASDSSKPSKTKPESVTVCVEYAKERGLQNPELDGNWFWDRGLTSGWKINKRPMLDWRAAFRTWQSQGYFPSQKQGQPQKRQQQNTEEILDVPML